MAHPSTVRGSAENELQPPNSSIISTPPISAGYIPPKPYGYYPVLPSYPQLPTPLYVQGAPPSNHVHDTWSYRRCDAAVYNYPPPMSNTMLLANQLTSQLYYHTAALHTFPHHPTAYYGGLLQQGPKWQDQSYPAETIPYGQYGIPVRQQPHNGGHPASPSYARITHEQQQPHQSMSMSLHSAETRAGRYTIVDGSISRSHHAGKVAHRLGNESGRLIPPHLPPVPHAHAHILPSPTPTPLGPPRKPKQSGYALWVGNLPNRVSIVDLKEHFSQGATTEIESVFLIANSKCAFVNYKTESACVSAVTRFHDSRFQGVRLVCRLRRGGAGSENNGSRKVLAPLARGDGGDVEQEESREKRGSTSSGKESRADVPAKKRRERYFILKSLTIEDLERSRINGVWATQRHNEAVLNEAYETSEAVYLIFSANKSGEYFGYGRMASRIPTTASPGESNGDNSSNVNGILDGQQPIPAPATVIESDYLIITPTPRTATAPPGSIVDDPARGTIFWEIDRTISDTTENDDTHPDADGSGSGDTNTKTANETSTTKPGKTEGGKLDNNINTSDDDDGQGFGRPFSVEWLCWRRLPFHRTRGLRNPWNANKEVKIARDGTEVETGVGRRLVALFGVGG
ncbi:hypothetical protein AJ79_00182 [Helicocarpus griseus UAMH5409]|uniref:YTH domain-containing protein n=1 Tax=Helicocarpus griseus UAMH5409 TaxID=1447875 RepID=A0A2B7YCF7_9EURO|nr:hypothetical protein AJ79_00182 [Helicocarpus griseus UAMH5409]